MKEYDDTTETLWKMLTAVLTIAVLVLSMAHAITRVNNDKLVLQINDYETAHALALHMIEEQHTSTVTVMEQALELRDQRDTCYGTINQANENYLLLSDEYNLVLEELVIYQIDLDYCEYHKSLYADALSEEYNKETLNE